MVYVEVLGEVPTGFVELVKGTLLKAYDLIGAKPELLEVYIYGSTEAKLRYLAEEATRSGVLVVGDFALSHDAWAGWPRIHVDYEKCKGLKRDVLEALLVHEGVHSVIHGNLSSYVIELKGDLISELGEEALEAYYVASTAVKDLEVHGYLVSHGLSDYVTKYYEYSLGGLAGHDCSSVVGLLEFSKLVSPCIYVNCEPSPETLAGHSCRDAYDEVMRALRAIAHSGKKLSDRVNSLIKAILDVTKRRRVPGPR